MTDVDEVVRLVGGRKGGPKFGGITLMGREGAMVGAPPPSEGPKLAGMSGANARIAGPRIVVVEPTRIGLRPAVAEDEKAGRTPPTTRLGMNPAYMPP